MGKPIPPKPYDSVSELPSAQKIEQDLALIKMLEPFMPAEAREKLRDGERKHRELEALVEAFYRLLGPRKWVFTNDLSVVEMAAIVATNDPVLAEEQLIAYYKQEKHISFQLILLNRIPAMKPRISLLEKALVDYLAGRYYSAVLVLLAMMDGFVSDVDKAHRKNLNSRPAEDMVPFDSVAGHRLGLSHAHATFNESVWTTDTAEVSDLFRNGIMHGMLVNFDNDVVATKAWNRLFALADWANGRAKQAKPPKPERTLEEVLREREEVQAVNRRMADWSAYEYEVSDVEAELTDLDRTCADFFQRWERQQWSPLCQHFRVPVPRPLGGKLAQTAKSLYSDQVLTGWSLEHVFHRGASMAESQVALEVNGEWGVVLLRWLYTDAEGEHSYDWIEGGVWRLAVYDPRVFLRPKR